MRVHTTGRSTSNVVAAVALAVVGAAVVLGLVTGLWASALRPVLREVGLAAPAAPSTLPHGGLASSTPVAVPAGSARPASAAALRERLDALPKPPGTMSGAVVDLATGRQIWGRDEDAGRMPASTMKILTAISALERLGPDHRFTTSVVRDGDDLVLVGGGDPYLGSGRRAGYPGSVSVVDLARASADRLAADGVRTVRLRADLSAFSGPAWNPSWPPAYRDSVTPIVPLWVDEGRLAEGGTVPRSTDPSADALRAFGAELGRRGIRVTSTDTHDVSRAPAGAQRIAAVESMPLSSIVEEVIRHSDNDGAELLLRSVAIAAGQLGSTEAGVEAARAALADLGIPVEGLTMVDGSGLSRENRVSAATMAGVAELATSDDHPGLRAVLTGMPVAGSEGTLSTRYTAEGAGPGRGIVRAKTGTLTGVSTLAGHVETADHERFAFAFLLNDAADADAARSWLDRATASVAACGCTG